MSRGPRPLESWSDPDGGHRCEWTWLWCLLGVTADELPFLLQTWRLLLGRAPPVRRPFPHQWPGGVTRQAHSVWERLTARALDNSSLLVLDRRACLRPRGRAHCHVVALPQFPWWDVLGLLLSSAAGMGRSPSHSEPPSGRLQGLPAPGLSHQPVWVVEAKHLWWSGCRTDTRTHLSPSLGAACQKSLL